MALSKSLYANSLELQLLFLVLENWLVHELSSEKSEIFTLSVLSAAVVRGCSVKKLFLKISQNSQEKLYFRVSFSTKFQAWGLNKKETLAQVFPCEFCDIFKNIFFIEHLRLLLLRH